MVRTLVDRDLAEPAGAEFDASVDVYTDGQSVPTLGTITGEFRKRRLGPSADPVSDGGWSYVLSNQIGGSQNYHEYDSSAISRGLMVSSWWWIDHINDPTAGHRWNIISFMTNFSSTQPELALNIENQTFFSSYRSTRTNLGVSVPLKQWIELAAAWFSGPGGQEDDIFRILYRLEGESSWTQLAEIIGSDTGTGIFADVNAVRIGPWPNSTNSVLTRYGGFSIYSIDAIGDSDAVDDLIGPPVTKRRHWAIDASGDDNNEGSQDRPWATVDRANSEMALLAILPTTTDRTAVDSALATIETAETTDDHVANDTDLENALDAFYLPCDVLHIGDADFGDDALTPSVNGLVITGDGGEPNLRYEIQPGEWSPDTRANVYVAPGDESVVIWEDEKWLNKRDFADSETATLDALATDPDGTFYCDDTNIFLKTDADPATSGRVYKRSRFRSTSGTGTSAILVGSNNVQVRDITLRGTTLAQKGGGDGVQAYCLQWSSGTAGGICEARDITADKGSKHTLGVTGTAAGSAWFRRRVTYLPMSPYAHPNNTMDVDFSAGANSIVYYYGCNATEGIIGEFGQVNGDPTVAASMWVAHGTPSDWGKFINCSFGRGTFSGQGTFQGSEGFSMVDVQSGGGTWAEPITIDRCRSDYKPFGVWSGSHQAIITNSIMVVRIQVAGFGFEKLVGPGIVQGCTIDLRENPTGEFGPHKSVWDCSNTTPAFDFHGNLFLTTKGFGIIGQGQDRVISSNYNVFMFENTVRLQTAISGGSDFDTWSEWQARGHDLNSELLTTDLWLLLGPDYLPKLDSALGDFVPEAEVPALVGLLDYNGDPRPAEILTDLTVGALEVDMTTIELLEDIKAKTDLIGTGEVVVSSPVSQSGEVTIVRGRDYNQADGNAIDFVNEEGNWPDLTGAAVVMRLARPGKREALHEFDGSVVAATGTNQTVRFEPSSTDTTIAVTDYALEVVATQSDGHVHTLTVGTLHVILGREAPSA